MKFEFKQRLIGFGVFILLFILFLPIFLHRSHPVNKSTQALVAPVKPATTVAKNANLATKATSIHFKLNPARSNPRSSASKQVSVTTTASLHATVLKKNTSSAIAVTKKALRIVKKKKQQLAQKVDNNKKSGFQQRGAQGRWLVQLGTFSRIKNANRLLKTLKEKGYNGFTSRTKLKNGRYFTLVFAGPTIKRSSATKLQKRILNQLHLKGVIKYSKS